MDWTHPLRLLHYKAVKMTIRVEREISANKPLEYKQQLVSRKEENRAELWAGIVRTEKKCDSQYNISPSHHQKLLIAAPGTCGCGGDGKATKPGQLA